MALLLKGARLIDPSCDLDSVMDMVVKDGKIKEIGTDLSIEKGITKDLSGKIIMPAFFDMHVHFRDPGQEHKEDTYSGSRAAAKGGFTGVCTMPNTAPTCDTAAVVEHQINRAQQAGYCKVYPIGALTKGLKGVEIAEIGDMSQAGAVAFSDDGRGVQNAGVERLAMDYVKQFNKPVISHCEDTGLSGSGVVNEGVVSTRLGLAGWPAEAEEIQIKRDIDLSRLTGCSLHIAHITTKRGVEAVKQAKQEGLKVSCEVCPHHLFLCEDDIDTTYNTNLKMNPPLRTKEDMLYLQEALISGDIDCIVTDHAPHARHEKEVEFELAPFGIIGLESCFALIHTNLVKNNRLSYQDLVYRMSIAPRKILGLEQISLKEGSRADLVVIDPDCQWTFSESDIASKSSNSPFIGYEFIGKVYETYLDGYATLEEAQLVEKA